MRIFEMPQLAFAAVASAGGSVVVRDATVSLASVPSLAGLLAAFAGAGLILSFLPARADGLTRALGTIVFCTLLGWLGGPLAVKYLRAQADLFVGADLLLAFAVAAATQMLIPLLIEYRTQIITWAAGFIPGRKGGGS